MKTPEEIGNKLRELRGDKPQREVANDLGISYQALCNYECGIRIPRDEIKVQISKYYNVPIADLFY